MPHFWFLQAKLPGGYIKINVTIIQWCLQKTILVQASLEQVVIVNAKGVSKRLASTAGISEGRIKGSTAIFTGAIRNEQITSVFLTKDMSDVGTREQL